MATLNNRCPFCGQEQFLRQASFNFNGESYTIIYCDNTQCKKVIVSVKDEMEKQMHELNDEIKRINELMFKDNSDI